MYNMNNVPMIEKFFKIRNLFIFIFSSFKKTFFVHILHTKNVAILFILVIPNRNLMFSDTVY